MQNPFILAALGLATLILVGCSSSYTMTTKSGETIKTQEKPESDQNTGMTTYADAYGYHRQISTSDVAQVVEGAKEWTW